MSSIQDRAARAAEELFPDNEYDMLVVQPMHAFRDDTKILIAAR